MPVVCLLASREHEEHCLCEQASSDETENLKRRLIEPLRIVDQADQWPLGGNLGEQAEDGETDEKPVRGVPRRRAERDLQRPFLGLGQGGEVVEHRQAELMQRGEGHLQLGLHARDLRDPTARRLLGAVLH